MGYTILGEGFSAQIGTVARSLTKSKGSGGVAILRWELRVSLLPWLTGQTGKLDGNMQDTPKWRREAVSEFRNDNSTWYNDMSCLLFLEGHIGHVILLVVRRLVCDLWDWKLSDICYLHLCERVIVQECGICRSKFDLDCVWLLVLLNVCQCQLLPFY